MWNWLFWFHEFFWPGKFKTFCPVCFLLHSVLCLLTLFSWKIAGHSAETSGGLLICLPREQAAAYCKVCNNFTSFVYILSWNFFFKIQVKNSSNVNYSFSRSFSWYFFFSDSRKNLLRKYSKRIHENDIVFDYTSFLGLNFLDLIIAVCKTYFFSVKL